MRSMGHVTRGDASDIGHGPAATSDDVIQQGTQLVRLSLPISESIRTERVAHIWARLAIMAKPPRYRALAGLFQSPAPYENTINGYTPSSCSPYGRRGQIIWPLKV